MSRILNVDPAQRITMEGIYDHPWFRKNLPPGVREMNDRPPPLPATLQSVAEIKAILAEAQQGHGGAAAQQDFDDYIDDAMDKFSDYDECA
jgi:serine/threonine protein kinase